MPDGTLQILNLHNAICNLLNSNEVQSKIANGSGRAALLANEKERTPEGEK